MILWISIIISSAIVGILCGLFAKGRIGVISAGAIPWFGLLACLLYSEYFLPYQGGGASMWPIAQLFAGTISAAIGVITQLITKFIISRSLQKRIPKIK